MSADDGPVLARAQRGDRSAFGELVRKYQRRVYATAFHLTGNHGDADDVAQDAFMRAYKALGTFDGRADFYTWLYRIVVNTALNLIRTRKHAGQALPDGNQELSAGITGDPRVAAESRELVAAVVHALGELPETLRVTLVLATLEEMPYKKIAETLAIPEGTVAWRVNQARKLMRRKLAALSPETLQGTTDDVLRRTREALGGP